MIDLFSDRLLWLQNVRRVLNDRALTSLLNWALRIRMAHDISLAMHYLHSRNIVHRDLKSANVLVTSDLRCKVTDFGNSRLVDPKQTAGQQRQRGALAKGGRRQLSRPLTMKFNFGGWIAPEVIDGKSYDAHAVDVFSFGILLCEIITGLDTEELPRDESGAFAHMGIGALDAPALTQVLAPYLEEGAPKDLVALALASVVPAAKSRPTMEAGMNTLGKLAGANKCPDLMDLHADMASIAALEDEVTTYIERFRQLETKSGGSDRVSSADLNLEREQSDYRFSRSFIQEGDDIAAKLHAAVHGSAATPDNGGGAGEGGPRRSAGGDADGKSSTCLVM